MHLMFLIPLSTALVAGYISYKTKGANLAPLQDELTYLTATITVISLLISLILAPWQLQLLILVLAGLNTKKYIISQ